MQGVVDERTRYRPERVKQEAQHLPRVRRRRCCWWPRFIQGYGGTPGRVLERLGPSLVAIGAPLSLPSGLCCLEESCSCSLVEGRKGRVAEEELASNGIGCFYTNKRSIVRKLIYRAIELRTELEQKGNTVIEAYPYATKVKLFNGKVPGKSNPESLMFLRKRLPELVAGLEPYVKNLNHDRCDAVLTAYTGRLSQAGLTEMIGCEDEGYINIPIGPAARNGSASANGRRSL